MTIFERATSRFPHQHVADDSQTLVLFSSNIRPQYEQDIIDVLAGPQDQLFRFRYSEDIVDSTIREKWEMNTLKDETDLDVLVVLFDSATRSISRPRLRAGPTGESHPDHSRGFDLRGVFQTWGLRPTSSPRREGPETMTGDDFGTMVRDFTNALNGVLNGSPAENDKTRRDSAAVGKVPGDIVLSAATAEVQHRFEAASAYLRRTVSFYACYFWRISEISGPKVGEWVPASEPGLWRLFERTLLPTEGGAISTSVDHAARDVRRRERCLAAPGSR